GCAPSPGEAALARWEQVWGFPVPRAKGLTANDQVEASARGEIDVFWIVGGNFLETLSGAERNRAALSRPGLRIHQDIVVSSSMLVEPSDTVLLLPAATRYEMPGGVTETSTERRIIFSPEVPGRRIGSARPEWEVFGEVCARVRPQDAGKMHFDSTAEIRAEIARALPLYAGIEKLAKQGDSVQWGGETLFADGRFATPDGKARFKPVPLPARQSRDGRFFVSTRRGKQFNSMVQREVDPLFAPFFALSVARDDGRARRISRRPRAVARIVGAIPHAVLDGQARLRDQLVDAEDRLLPVEERHLVVSGHPESVFRARVHAE